MTENHNYNTPAEGAVDWHVPLNENFEQLDRAVEIRDSEANRENYTPKTGAKFLATDTGRRFLGDGSQWLPAPPQPLTELNAPSVQSDPADPAAGQLWYREDTNELKVQLQNAVTTLATGTETGETDDGTSTASGLIDGFNGSSLSSAWNTISEGFEMRSDRTFEGSGALYHGPSDGYAGIISAPGEGLPGYAPVGTTVRVHMWTDELVDKPSLLLGVPSPSAFKDLYMLEVRWGRGDIRIRKRYGRGDITTIAKDSVSVNTNTWYAVEGTRTADGTVTMRLVEDPNGTATEVGVASTTDTEFADNAGVGLLSNNITGANRYFDGLYGSSV